MVNVSTLQFDNHIHRPRQRNDKIRGSLADWRETTVHPDAADHFPLAIQENSTHSRPRIVDLDL